MASQATLERSACLGRTGFACVDPFRAETRSAEQFRKRLAIEILVVARRTQERAGNSRPTVRQANGEIPEGGSLDEEDAARGQQRSRPGKEGARIAQVGRNVPHHDDVESMTEFVGKEVVRNASESPRPANFSARLRNVYSFDLETQSLGSEHELTGTASDIQEPAWRCDTRHDLVADDPGYGGDVGRIAPISGIVVREGCRFHCGMIVIRPVQPAMTASVAKEDESCPSSRFGATGRTIHHQRQQPICSAVIPPRARSG